MPDKTFVVVMLMLSASFADCGQLSEADVPMSVRIVYPGSDPWRIVTEKPLEASDILEMPNRREVLIKDKKWLKKLSKVSELHLHESEKQVQYDGPAHQKNIESPRLVDETTDKDIPYDYYLVTETTAYKTSTKFVMLMQYAERVDTISLSDWERVYIRYNDSFVWDERYYCDVIAIACKYDKSLKTQARLHYYDGGYHIRAKR